MSLLSGVDLLLRPHQQQQIKEFIEELTLRVHYIDLAEIKNKLASPSVQALLVKVSAFQLGILAMFYIPVAYVMLPFQRKIASAEGLDGNLLTFPMALIAVAAFLLPLTFAWRWPLPNIIRRIIGDGDVVTIKRRRVAFIIIGTILTLIIEMIFMVAFVIINNGIRINGIQSHRFFFFISLPFLSYAGVYYVTAQSISMALKPTGWSVRLTLGLIRSVLWRIVEYNKGVVAALVSIATILLTVLKILSAK